MTVTREVERKERGVALPVTVETTDDDGTAFRLSQRLPEAFPMEKAGFKPDEEPGDWWIDGQTVVVEDHVVREDPCEFVLGLLVNRDAEPTSGWDFEPPSIEIEDVSIDTGSPASDDGSDEQEAVAASATADTDTGATPSEPMESDQSAAESVDSPGGDRDGTDPDGEEPSATPDPTSTVAAVEQAIDEGSDTGVEDGRADAADTPDQPAGDGDDSDANPEAADTDDTGSSSTGDRSVVADLVAELDDGDVDEEQLTVLRDAVDPPQSTSEQVRMEHLQARVEDVAAYADAMEEILDEHGTSEEFLSEFRSDIDDLAEDLEAVQDSVEEAASERAEVEDDLAELADATDDASDDRDRLDERIDTIEEAVEDLREDVSDLQSMRDMMATVLTGDDADQDAPDP